MAYKRKTRKKSSARRAAPKKPWKSYKKATLLRKAVALRIKGAASMKKSQLIWHLSRKCKRPGTRKRAKVCRRKKVVRRYKKRRSARKSISLRGKSIAQLRAMARARKLKSSGPKKLVAARLYAHARRRKKR